MDAYIRHWLHEEPAEDMEAWGMQQAKAQWLEERYFTTLARVIHGVKKG